ncbi:bifunctional folylpolyglutamate synthase/dihydrofolate synthase [Chloroflexota bacterium]
MDIQQALDYIYSFIDYEKVPRPRDAANYDLRRMDELLARLGDPHLNTRTAHIAGSKGKGSVAAMVTSTLTVSGYTTGFFTSPHLHTFNERVRVDNTLISDEEIVSLAEKIKPEVEVINEKATYGLLTTFEIITALAFTYFDLKKVDFQVIEVGLGGRLDATNVVPEPEVSVITSISFDHMEVLGDTLTQIASEKAGIIRPDSIVVSSPQVEEASKVIEETCHNKNAKLIKVGRDVIWEYIDSDIARQSLVVKGRLGDYQLSVPLLGQHQMENAATAVATLEVLEDKGFNISKSSITKGLAEVKWPGRLQVLNHNPLVVVDGAHNPDSARRLRQSLEQYFNFDKALLIIGASSDKDINKIVSELAPVFNMVIATHSTHPRAMATSSIISEFEKYGIKAQATDDISIALRQALDMVGEKDLICVTGSLFVVAGAIEQAEELNLKV